MDWQDYDTGAPITAQMLAGKIDIGSMGDYPLLINGSRAGTGDGGDSMVAVTGYNLEGALNGVVAGGRLRRRDARGPRGQAPSRPASAPRATARSCRRSRRRASTPPRTCRSRTRTRRSAPPRCRPARSTRVAQFVAWPALLAFRDDARLVYDGGRLEVPTLHGTVVRNEYVAEQRGGRQGVPHAPSSAPPSGCTSNPVEAAEIVAEETGLPVEVVYLYNGRGGVSTFDTTLKEEQVAALEQDVPFLESIGVLEDPVDVGDVRRRQPAARGLGRRLRPGRRRHREPRRDHRPRRGLRDRR